MLLPFFLVSVNALDANIQPNFLRRLVASFFVQANEWAATTSARFIHGSSPSFSHLRIPQLCAWVLGLIGAMYLVIIVFQWRNATRKLTLGYWRIRGLGAPIRYALQLRGVEYEEVIYEQGDAPGFSKSQWMDVKPTIGSPFANLPYLIDSSLGSRPLVQSKAILQHLGRTLNLYGESEADRCAIDEAIYAMDDIRSAFTSMCYRPDFPEKIGAFVDSLPAKLSQLEQQLQFQRDRAYQWVASRQLSIADLFIYEVLENFMFCCPRVFDQLPLCRAFHDAVHCLPEMVAYRASPRSKQAGLDFNNKAAVWRR